MAKSLTGQQLKFCEGIADGKTQVDSYRAAYPKAKEASVMSNAARLMENDGVAAKIKELRDASETKNTLSRQELREIRAQIARNDEDESAARLAALRDEAKMMGWDEPEKRDDKLTIEIKTDYRNG